MELEGSLRAFKFPEILQFLGRGQMTGILSLRREGEEVRISFRDGQITGASSSVRTVRIGDMLLYAGRITRQALDEALEAQESAGGSPRFLGDILIQRGLVTEDDLRNFIELQVKEEVWDLFNWEDGSFRFEQSAVRKAGAIEVKLDVEPMLLEGSRRLDEWQIIRSNIGGGNEVFRVNPDLTGPPDVDLDINTWQVLSLVNGRLSVDSIVRLSNFGKFDTYFALDSLLRAGVIVSVNDPYDIQRDTGAIRAASAAPSSNAGAAESNSRNSQNASEGRAVPSILSLFGRRRNAQSGEPEMANGGAVSTKAAGQHFETDVAMTCAVVNSLIDALAGSSAFTSEGDFADWLIQTWRATEQRYPRADLLRLEGRHVSASRYDRYARLEGAVNDAIRGCHEDCLEALRGLWSALIEKARDRMDASAVDKMADQCLQSFMQARPEIVAPEFSLTRWTRQRR